MKKSANKYGAKKVKTVEGSFDSIAEYRHYLRLKADNNVVAIARQIKYTFEVNGIKLGWYVADFLVCYQDGHTEVHEVKNTYLLERGKSTPAGQLARYKKKLMLALHNVEIIYINTNGKSKATKGKAERHKVKPR